MMEIIKNNHTLVFAILGGGLPAFFWLWFWLREEDDDNMTPRSIIMLSFILGAILVMVAIWMEKFSLNFVTDNKLQIIVWASIEELLKFAGVAVIVFGGTAVNRPIDYPMYFIGTALGFAALENILYLIHPIDVSGTVVGLLTGNLRYLGSTLLHSIASGMIGSALGLSFYIPEYRLTYLSVGIICAITLHSVFNFFIMKGSGENFLSVFGFLWVVAIINILIFEKLKRMGESAPVATN